MWQKHKKKIILFLSVLGPGIIAATANNDASGISLSSIVGSHYGYQLLWVLILLTIAMAVTQETGARVAMVTGKGLAGLIRENFGLRLTVVAMASLLIANIGTLIAEFAGVAVSFNLLGISKYVAVPLAALVVWLVLYKGSFKTAEKIFLVFALFYIFYIISAFLVKPDWLLIAKKTVIPSINWNKSYLMLFLAMIGTTLTPWGQFFIQAYVVDKGLNIRDYKYEKAEIYSGAIIAELIVFFITVTAANTLFKNGIYITDAESAALALEPVAGHLAKQLFSLGLFAASMLGAFILPVTTAYALCDSFGWQSGFNNKWKEAPTFYGIILGLIVMTAGFILIPALSLLRVIVVSQIINGVLIIVILIYLLRLVNNKQLMGKHANKPLANIIGCLIIIALILATLFLFGFMFFGGEKLAF